MKNDPAFPISKEIAESNPVAQGGLTKREMFAAMAMQGILSKGLDSQGTIYINDHNHTIDVASVIIADALIRELEVKK